MPVQKIFIEHPFGVSEEVRAEISELEWGLNHRSARLDNRSLLELLRRVNLELRSCEAVPTPPQPTK